MDDAIDLWTVKMNVEIFHIFICRLKNVPNSIAYRDIVVESNSVGVGSKSSMDFVELPKVAFPL